MKKNYDREFFDEHIADLGREVSHIETLVPVVVKMKDEAQKKAAAIPKNSRTKKFENFASYSVWALQSEVQELMLHNLESTMLYLKEFAQIWEQHKLLADYVDLALGETSDAIRTEFHGKVKETLETFRNDPVRLGILSYLDKVRESKAKYQGGPGDV